MKRKERAYFFESGQIRDIGTGRWKPAYTRLVPATLNGEVYTDRCPECGNMTRKLAQSTRAEILARCRLEGAKAAIFRSRENALAAMQSEAK